MIWGGVVLSVAFIILSIINNFQKSTYLQTVLDYREQKDQYFKTSANSPIENKEGFEGLHYFEPNAKFKVKAKLTRISDSSAIIVTRNDGRTDMYKRYGYAKFKLDKKYYQLTLLVSSDTSTTAFVPFADQTNGAETYQGGRYLDVPLKSKNGLILDFNFAYNPFCVYSYKFSCPLPPKENFLEKAILAGEKTWLNREEEPSK